MGLCYVIKLVEDQLKISKRKDFFFPWAVIGGKKNLFSLMCTYQIASVFSVLKKNTMQHRPVVWLSRHLLQFSAVLKRILVLAVQSFFKGEAKQADGVTGWDIEIAAGTFPSRKSERSCKCWEVFTNNRFFCIFSPLFWNDKEWYINHPNIRREMSQYHVSIKSRLKCNLCE